MAVGPVQLITLGFPHPNFHGEIIAELERLRDGDTVRVIDALAVYKDGAGDVEVVHLSNLTRDEAVESGSVIGALIGLVEDGEEGMEAGAVRVARRPPTGSTPSAVPRPGTFWTTSRTIPRQRSSCWNISGPSRCAMPSSGPAATGSATGSSAHWT